MSNLGNKEVLSRNLKRYLSATDLTVRDFADRLGVPYTTVLDWFNAKTYPRIDKIEMMAKFFGVEKSDLIEDKPQQKAMSQRRKYLLDKVKFASESDLEKLAAIFDIISEEDKNN